MNRMQSPKISVGVIPEQRRNNLAVLKNAIREGSYKVKADGLAEKILKEWEIELGLIFHNHKYQKWGDN